jgi:hypothetical protein
VTTLNGGFRLDVATTPEMKWWQLKKRSADLERELRSDLELEEEEQRESGLSTRRSTLCGSRAFGNTTLIRTPGALPTYRHESFLNERLGDSPVETLDNWLPA